MKKNIRNIRNLVLFLVIFVQVSYGQEGSVIHRCGYDEAVRSMEEKNPGYKNEIDKTFERAKRYNNYSYRDEVLTIPVVVHIVYQNQSQNIPEGQILKVIESLNKDFRHSNDNAGDLRPEFVNVVGDPMIVFDLVEIKRKSTNKTFKFNLLFGTFPDYVKTDAGGGSSGLDTDKYLNIWVCNIDGGALLGYSYPPSCAPNWPSGVGAPSKTAEGVVIHYKAFNTGTTYSAGGNSIPIEGRTLTHEVGHFLGLRHIWGDGTSTVLGIADCTVDDGIYDTPNQGLPSQNTCKKFQNTCTDSGNNDKNDMIENYMDYSDERCMSAFTKGQIQVMRGVLLSCRKDLLYPVGIEKQPIQSIGGANIYPNPTLGKITIELQDKNEDWKDLKIIFYSELGQSVTPQSIIRTNNNYTCDMSNLDNGLYFLKISFSEKLIMKKIIVTK